MCVCMILRVFRKGTIQNTDFQRHVKTYVHVN